MKLFVVQSSPQLQELAAVSPLPADEEEVASVEEVAAVEELGAVEEVAAVEECAAVEELAVVCDQSAGLVPSWEEASCPADST